MTYDQYIKILKQIKPSEKHPDLIFEGYEHLIRDEEMSLESKVKIALGITDYEAGYSGSEALFVDTEEFDRVSNVKFKFYLDYWNLALQNLVGI